MCRLLTLASLLALPFPAFAAEEKTETIELGGLRQVRAVLSLAEGEYTVKVRMLPVRCFDDATNASLNREKARELALLALATHLGGKKSVRLSASGVQLSASGVQVEKTEPEGKFYTLLLRVPRNNVTVEAVDAEPTKSPPSKEVVERVALTGGLFTRKRDYLDTAKQLFAAVQVDVLRSETKAKERPQENDFLASVADIEEKAMKRLDRLAQEIKDDILLLDDDQEELKAALAKQKEQTIDLLKGVVQKYEAETEKQKEKPR